MTVSGECVMTVNVGIRLLRPIFKVMSHLHNAQWPTMTVSEHKLGAQCFIVFAIPSLYTYVNICYHNSGPHMTHYTNYLSDTYVNPCYHNSGPHLTHYTNYLLDTYVNPCYHNSGPHLTHYTISSTQPWRFYIAADRNKAISQPWEMFYLSCQFNEAMVFPREDPQVKSAQHAEINIGHCQQSCSALGYI
ncbi:hypothetical protein RRG08_007313 [Elysia crispata]|uniref:Uncharacterized protein n=1 Tax=Elysia crispata TaxID=231223 RepID=A0AAE0Y9F1_9GAST|nr:hypothetical protein RRG08_007313 [Elysia crispata]